MPFDVPSLPYGVQTYETFSKLLRTFEKLSPALDNNKVSRFCKTPPKEALEFSFALGNSDVVYPEDLAPRNQAFDFILAPSSPTQEGKMTTYHQSKASDINDSVGKYLNLKELKVKSTNLRAMATKGHSSQRMSCRIKNPAIWAMAKKG